MYEFKTAVTGPRILANTLREPRSIAHIQIRIAGREQLARGVLVGRVDVAPEVADSESLHALRE